MTGNVAQELPPPRPALTSDLAPPVGRSDGARPGPVRATAALWWAGCLAALVGLVAALVDYADLDARLTATATAEDPSAPAELLADGVRATIAVVAGGVALLVVVSLVWVALLLRRRSWARWALLATLLPTLLVLDVAQSVVAGDADLDRIALVVAAGLLAVALLPLLAGSARDWFHPAQSRPLSG
ncbi:hypothetical protein [Geodermatophilus ruber]|nr:hypothetical protein [Geodermatophilus ruber]